MRGASSSREAAEILTGLSAEVLGLSQQPHQNWISGAQVLMWAWKVFHDAAWVSNLTRGLVLAQTDRTIKVNGTTEARRTNSSPMLSFLGQTCLRYSFIAQYSTLNHFVMKNVSFHTWMTSVLQLASQVLATWHDGWNNRGNCGFQWALLLQ